MRPLARELGVVLPVSFFERRGQAYFNSCAVIDVDGAVLGVYRKSHIPDGPGYQEKFYFSPGDTGFLVFETRHATIGVGICWDQWFPEAARCLALGVRFWLFFCFSAAVRPSFVLYLGGGGGRDGRPSVVGRILAGEGGHAAARCARGKCDASHAAGRGWTARRGGGWGARRVCAH